MKIFCPALSFRSNGSTANSFHARFSSVRQAAADPKYSLVGRIAERRISALIEISPVNRCAILVLDDDIASNIEKARQELTRAFEAAGCPVWRTRDGKLNRG